MRLGSAVSTAVHLQRRANGLRHVSSCTKEGMNVWGCVTSEGDFPGNLGKWGVDEFLEVDLLILNVVERLARAKGGFAEAQRTGRLVTVQRLYVEYLEGIGNVVGAQGGASAVSHELESFLQDLGQAVVDIAR